MKNYEKYADEIREYEGNYFCNEFIKPNILKTKSCIDMSCNQCSMLQMLWLLEDYKESKEPEVDWSNVEVDTPILVRDNENEEWLKRHFAKHEWGTVYSWNGGKTSWTKECMTSWKYAKLAESEEE